MLFRSVCTYIVRAGITFINLCSNCEVDHFTLSALLDTLSAYTSPSPSIMFSAQPVTYPIFTYNLACRRLHNCRPLFCPIFPINKSLLSRPSPLRAIVCKMFGTFKFLCAPPGGSNIFNHCLTFQLFAWLNSI